MDSKKYKPQMGIFWWTDRWSSIKFILRELTSVAVAVYSIIFLFYVSSILQGKKTFEEFSESLKSPAFIALHCFILLCLVFHSITWFNLAPQAMVIKLGEKKVPGIVVALMNYAGWFFISLAILWLVTNLLGT
ncbi:MAG: hypothetical protein HY015_00990 [Bacteroidetes bacterium]|nr:hypothetical protein [Bacteroidota bacterium]MBI3481553.1 hypothetical protein [Bacteroidota bacterium]